MVANSPVGSVLSKIQDPDQIIHHSRFSWIPFSYDIEYLILKTHPAHKTRLCLPKYNPFVLLNVTPQSFMTLNLPGIFLYYATLGQLGSHLQQIGWLKLRSDSG